MPLHRSIPQLTKEQEARQRSMRERGCVVSRILGLGYVWAEVHHLVDRGRTIGQDYTIALNPWSHRGVPFGDWSINRCRELFGPSYALERKSFRARFGSDQDLLNAQNDLIGSPRIQISDALAEKRSRRKYKASSKINPRRSNAA